MTLVFLYLDGLNVATKTLLYRCKETNMVLLQVHAKLYRILPPF